MSHAFHVILYMGLSAYAEPYAKGAWACPVLSLFGAKTSVQTIAVALVRQKLDVFLAIGERTHEVYLTVGEHPDLWENPPLRGTPCDGDPNLGAYQALCLRVLFPS